ncbi:MAG TPA: hypothetical protein VKZ96_15015 [Thermomicrobiales bacterium]|nr:hypothetical protein [Thermomicrobiales bacterium]
MARVSTFEGTTGRVARAGQRRSTRFPESPWQQLVEVGRILALSVFSPQTLVAEEQSWVHQDRRSARDDQRTTQTTKADTQTWHTSW